MGVARQALITRGEKNIKWLETFCTNTSGGYLMLSVEQCDAVRRVYDDGKPGAASVDDLELTACLRLLHLVGREAQSGTTIKTTRPGEFLRACSVAKRSPLLWRHLAGASLAPERAASYSTTNEP
jgi:hypothetical protein